METRTTVEKFSEIPFTVLAVLFLLVVVATYFRSFQIENKIFLTEEEIETAQQEVFGSFADI